MSNAEPRRILPRRALPNGRAVVGALLVTVAVTGTYAYAHGDDQEPTTEYLVVVDDIAVGQPVQLSDVEFVAMALPPGVATHALRSTNGLEGSIVLNRLNAGAILDARDLHGAPFVDGVAVTGVHELTIPVPSDRSPAIIHRGDRVTVLAYSTPDETLHTAIEDALVLGFDSDPAGFGSSGAARLTLALPEAADAASLARWSYQALTVVLTSRDLDDVYPDVVEPPTTTIAETLGASA